jgi:hypothetical protein
MKNGICLLWGDVIVNVIAKLIIGEIAKYLISTAAQKIDFEQSAIFLHHF